jgi:hypothetical protein
MTCQEEEEDVARSHQSVDWGQYFLSIESQCPWSLMAWAKGKIDIVNWCGQVKALDVYRARVYVVKNTNRRRLKKLCKKLDHGECEWLWSTPGYGQFATPVPVLIQQNRRDLSNIRSQLK